MNFIMIGLLLRQALDRLRVRLNMLYLVTKKTMNCKYFNNKRNWKLHILQNKGTEM